MSKIQVYTAKSDILNDDALFKRVYNSVSKRRREKTDSLMFRKGKNLSLAAEFLLMQAAGDFGITGFEIKYGENGKPYFADERLYFNLSHSGERVMCVIGENEAGCDIEKVRRINTDIARRYFYAGEYESIMAEKSDDAKADVFFRLWTLKESFMKAVGLGMRLPLDSFSIDISGSTPQVFHNVNKEKYYFGEYDFGDGYKYAVCSTNDSFAEMQFVEIK